MQTNKHKKKKKKRYLKQTHNNKEVTYPFPTTESACDKPKGTTDPVHEDTVYEGASHQEE